MRILVVHLGNISENLVASSILKEITQKVEDPEITWTVESSAEKYIFQYNRRIARVLCLSELQEISENFDLLVNLSQILSPKQISNIKFEEVLGFSFDKDNHFEDYRAALEGNMDIPSLSLFQMYHKLTGLTWRGEGYQIGYYPRNKSKRNRAGVAVAHANLRNYVSEELDLESMRIWYIPYKKNIFKYMDEINKCHKIITDNLTTFHLAMSLRKYVYFLKTFPLNMKLELFGNGQIYDVPHRVFQ